MQFEAQVQTHNMQDGEGGRGKRYGGTAGSRYLENRRTKTDLIVRVGEGTNNLSRQAHQMKVHWTKVSSDESLLDESSPDKSLI